MTQAVAASAVVTLLLIVLLAGTAWYFFAPWRDQARVDHLQLLLLQQQQAGLPAQLNALRQQVVTLQMNLTEARARIDTVIATARQTAVAPPPGPSTVTAPVVVTPVNQIPSGLRAAFPPAGRQIIAASVQDAHGLLAERVRIGLGNVLEIRRNGVLVSGNAAQVQVDAAQRALDAGNLGAAVTALQALTGPALQAAQPWLTQARSALATSGKP